MNLAETLAGMHISTSSVSKENDMMTEHLLSEDETGLSASFGIAQDSFHWGAMEIVPPKDTTQVTNPGDPADKKRRKGKKFRKYEQELQRVQDSGPRPTLVQTTAFDNSDLMDVTRSSWFV